LRVEFRKKQATTGVGVERLAEEDRRGDAQGKRETAGVGGVEAAVARTVRGHGGRITGQEGIFKIQLKGE
jgi:hypothetical protein